MTGGDPTSATDNTTNGATTTSNTTDTTDTTNTTNNTTDTSATDTDDPPPLGEACDGYATRYWDCCKAHCGWTGNVNPATQPAESCTQADQSHGGNYDVVNSCDSLAPDSAFTCYSNAPWAVSPTLAYGFAAVPANGDICGRCYQLEFTGASYNAGDDPGCAALGGKTMIVQATNIGYDVGGGQFDILTPGGGVGLFDACSYQWGVDTSELGATYGGFLTTCKQGGANTHDAIKSCVLGRCDAVFPPGKPELAELRAGCEWYVDWFEAADNPSLKYQEVACPQELVDISGVDRGPLDDVAPCEGGGGGECTQEIKDNCDCGWTNGGANCGNDDGSCCWEACCA
ncbi:MAG: hypothetical protein KC468_39125 [Myxococcales bacterium]|nr:hypothetical protein [Myxococcales bacterium]